MVIYEGPEHSQPTTASCMIQKVSKNRAVALLPRFRPISRWFPPKFPNLIAATKTPRHTGDLLKSPGQICREFHAKRAGKIHPGDPCFCEWGEDSAARKRGGFLVGRTTARGVRLSGHWGKSAFGAASHTAGKPTSGSKHGNIGNYREISGNI